jgi:O-methyltransferase involved in polyketide biosynthesis
MYLTRTAVKATLDAVWKVSGPGSAIAHDMWHLVDDPGPMGTARRLAPSALSFIGEPVTFAIHPEEMDHFLGRQGFRITDLVTASELQDRYAPDERALSDASLYVLASERISR